VVRAALNHRAGKTLDETAYRAQFQLHFEYGCFRLKQIWEDSGNDQVKFVSELLKIGTAGDGSTLDTRPTGAPPAQAIIEHEVQLSLLTEAQAWSMNGAGTKNGLLVISGEPG